MVIYNLQISRQNNIGSWSTDSIYTLQYAHSDIAHENCALGIQFWKQKLIVSNWLYKMEIQQRATQRDAITGKNHGMGANRT
jgi:hypothetical protein